MPQNPTGAYIAKNSANALVPLLVNSAGQLEVASVGAPVGASAKNITTAASTQVKTGSGTFSGLSINTGGSGSTATFYDGTSTSGTKLGTFATATAASLSGLNIGFTTGLFVVTAGGTPADITVTYF